jgi:hypothetical protein
MAFSELILVLLALSGFGVQPNANAPTAAEIQKYAPDDAEVMWYLDAEAIVPSNWSYFAKLSNDPVVAQVPELRDGMKEAVNHVDQMRAKIKADYGFDPITDVKSAAGWVTFNGKEIEDATMVIAVRGKFPADLLDKLAAKDLAGAVKAEKVEGRTFLGSKDGKWGATIAADGTALIGSMGAVRARASAKWAGKPKKGNLVERSAMGLGDKPFMYTSFQFSPVSIKFIEKQMGKEPEAAFLRDTLVGADFGSVGFVHNGMSWTYVAKTPAGHARAAQASEGAVQLLRAAHLVTRGFANLFLAAIDSYAGMEPSIAKLIKHKADIMKVVTAWSGEGNFTAAVDKKDAERRMTVKLTGKSFSDVVPGGALILGGGAMFLTMGRSAPMPATVTPAHAPAHTTTPVKATPGRKVP